MKQAGQRAPPNPLTAQDVLGPIPEGPSFEAVEGVGGRRKTLLLFALWYLDDPRAGIELVD